MAGPTNESGVVKAIVQAVYQHWPHAWHLNVHGSGMQRAGTPDLLFTINGKFFAFEVKHQKHNESKQAAYDRTSLIQRIQIQKIIDSGAVATTVLSAEEAVAILDYHLSV